jgi:hypothetical protein
MTAKIFVMIFELALGRMTVTNYMPPNSYVYDAKVDIITNYAVGTTAGTNFLLIGQTNAAGYYVDSTLILSNAFSRVSLTTTNTGIVTYAKGMTPVVVKITNAAGVPGAGLYRVTVTGVQR